MFSLNFLKWNPFAVAQGSVLRSLLFNIFLCDLFLHLNDIEFASNVDHMYTIHRAWQYISRGFLINRSKLYLISIVYFSSFKKKIKKGDFENENSIQAKLLWITIDNNLKFASYVENLCKNA